MNVSGSEPASEASLFLICGFQRLTRTNVSGGYGVSVKGQRSAERLSQGPDTGVALHTDAQPLWIKW